MSDDPNADPMASFLAGGLIKLSVTLALVAVIFMGIAWDAYVGPVRDFFLVIILLVLVALIIGAAVYVARRMQQG